MTAASGTQSATDSRTRAPMARLIFIMVTTIGGALLNYPYMFTEALFIPIPFVALGSTLAIAAFANHWTIAVRSRVLLMQPLIEVAVMGGLTFGFALFAHGGLVPWSLGLITCPPAVVTIVHLARGHGITVWVRSIVGIASILVIAAVCFMCSLHLMPLILGNANRSQVGMLSVALGMTTVGICGFIDLWSAGRNSRMA